MQPMTFGAVILAAGLSRRMGGENKLLKSFRGKPLVQWPIAAALASGADRVALVASPAFVAAKALEHECSRLSIVNNLTPERGLSHSLKLGLSALERCDAVAVLLGDMPDVDAALIDAMFNAWTGVHYACAPVYGDAMGHPIVLGREASLDCMKLEGDRGARTLLEANSARVRMVSVANAGALRDFDTPDDFAAVHKGIARSR